jgi:DNA (cytosine-5)-methyltransferase 1
MRIADLCCKAGGAAMGLHRRFPEAEIVGFDIEAQSRYPFTFVKCDALSVDLSSFDFVWASPPCQYYSPTAYKWGTQKDHPHLIPAVRAHILNYRKPYIIENIPQARPHLCNPVMLCGTFFDLGVFRHRLFECSFPVREMDHVKHAGKIGDGKYVCVAGHAGGAATGHRERSNFGAKNGSTAEWAKAMGIDWMVGAELAEAIPPAYSFYLAGEYGLSLT